MKIKFRSFKGRILFFFLGLFTLVQLFALIAVNMAVTKSARTRIGSDLNTGSRVFTRLLTDHRRQLTTTARILSGDYSFKSAYATGNRGATLAGLENRRKRINANMMMLVSTDNMVLADTLHPRDAARRFEFPELIRTAERSGSAVSTVFLGGRAYQMIVLPLAPARSAWLCTGFLVDDAMADDIRKITLSHVSFLQRNPNNKWTSIASTLPHSMLMDLLSGLPMKKREKGKTFSINLNGEEHVTYLMPLEGRENRNIQVVLQRSIFQSMSRFGGLRTTLFLLFALGLLNSVLGGVLIAHSVTNPVRTLLEGVRRIASGDYGFRVEIPQEDEIGELASSFNDMTRGLEERDRVRDLLGKVVSPQIAEELLSKKLELGGEEREVTILFSDIRNFTMLNENHPPRLILEILNTHLTRMSEVVEKHGGVVDKYIGDAVMALFGAPLQHEDDADRAMRAAIEMVRVQAEINEEFKRRDLPALEIGIGINTATVVAGNIGSQIRMNYSVIGDGVNIASRIESLTKDKSYNTSIIVSETTLQKAKGAYDTRFLGHVTVRGKSEPTTIHALSAYAAITI